MTTTDLIEPTTTGLVLMDANEARARVIEFNANMATADTAIDICRRALLDLHEREGWRALGYQSWRACAQAELRFSQATVYRLLGAAQVERDIAPVLSHDEKHLPEAVLRPLLQLDSPEQRQAAATAAFDAAGGAVPSSAQMRAAVEQIQPPKPRSDPYHPTILPIATVEDAERELSQRGWLVSHRAREGDWQLRKGMDMYATEADGVIAAARLLRERSYEPDELMAAINALDDAPPALPPDFAQAQERAAAIGLILDRDAARGYTYSLKNLGGSGVMDYGWTDILVHLGHQEQAHAKIEAERLRREPTGPLCSVCRTAPSAGRRTIGGEKTDRCPGCATQAERDDLTALIGDQHGQYNGTVLDAQFGVLHQLAWPDGVSGRYAYDDALGLILSANRQLVARKDAPPPPASHAMAAAWLAETRALLERAATGAMFRRDQIQAAVDVVAALIEERGPVPTLADSDPLASIAGRVGAVEVALELGDRHFSLADELRACRRALDDLADDPAVSTDAYDALSHRIGDAQARLMGSEVAV